MTFHSPQLRACMLCLLVSCTRNDVSGHSPPSAMNKASASADLPFEGRLPQFDAATAWINTKPLSAADLRGKAVLVQFWTYSCINWRRTMPYVRAWSEKYAASGLVVLGVHTPEFDFEKSPSNVSRFASEANVTFPIAVDSERDIWRAFGNEYWPALYFGDAEGRIRHHHFGEGDYERSEAIIQEMLLGAGKRGVPGGFVSVKGSGAEAAPDWANLRSPEIYLGYERTENFAAPGGASVGGARDYPEPAPPLRLNYWALSGSWTMTGERVTLNQAGGQLHIRFHARDVHLVMGAASSVAPLRFRVRIDGHPPGGAHGVDIDEHGNGTVAEPRMYQLIRQQRPIAERHLSIEFFNAPVEAFSFTFG